MNMILILAIATILQLGLDEPAHHGADQFGQDGERRHGANACICKEDTTEDQPDKPDSSENKDRNVGQSPYISCWRRARRSPDCPCLCPEDIPEDVEVKTGPYGLKSKQKKPG